MIATSHPFLKEARHVGEMEEEINTK